MVALKLRTIGNSVGIILPQEVLNRLHAQKGDMLYLTEAPEGYHLTSYAPEFETQMDAARKVMRKWRNLLRELAK